jgi:tripartite-type tricarboxylate transporter receptor subunit TctC
MSSALSERRRGRSHCRKVVRRLPARLLHGVGLFTLLSLIATGPAEAQDIWPARVIRMVNSLSAGSSADRLNRVLGQPAMRDVLLKQGMEPDASSPEGLREQLDDEIAKWARVIREAGIKGE